MTLKRAFELLIKTVGRVAAQLICSVVMLALIGLAFRGFAWLDGVAPFKLDPIYVILIVAISIVGFYIWRAFATANLNE